MPIMWATTFQHALPPRMIRLSIIPAVISLAAISTRSVAQAETASTTPERSAEGRAGARWQVSYIAGYRNAGSGWGPAREQVNFGIVDADVVPPCWPLAIAARMALSYTKAVPPGSPSGAGGSGAYDISLSLRRALYDHGEHRVWLGAGAAVVGASIRSKDVIEGTSQNEWQAHDATVGPYLEAGVQQHLRGRAWLGLSATWSHGHVRPAAQTLDAGGLALLALVGVR
jgi:hypothetical protein